AALTWAPMQVARAIASWFRVVIETLGSVPFAAVVAPYFPTSWLAAAVILNGGALAGIRLRRFFWQRRVWAAAALAAIVVSTLLLTRPDGRVHVYALDVGTGSYGVGGVTLSLAGDGRSWLIQPATGRMIVVAPETSWLALPADVDGAIFTSGGPADWLGPGQGFTVVQVAANSRDGLPVRAVLQALNGAPLYRTDRLGTVELVAAASHFLTPGLELD